MVKNTGGNKSKRLGRKHINNEPETKAVRYVIEEGEEYAVVTKLYGATCQVTCANGISRVCVIRKKFKGRGKRDNIIAPGIWVLIGIRDWEVISSEKQQKCDLLEVYSRFDRDKLIQNCPDDFSILRSISDDGDDGTSNIQFTEEFVSEDDDSIDELKHKNQNIINESESEDEDENEIDIDDI